MYSSYEFPNVSLVRISLFLWADNEIWTHARIIMELQHATPNRDVVMWTSGHADILEIECWLGFKSAVRSRSCSRNTEYVAVRMTRCWLANGWHLNCTSHVADVDGPDSHDGGANGPPWPFEASVCPLPFVAVHVSETNCFAEVKTSVIRQVR